METKDWIYVIGLILTSTVSAASLAISIKNRRNAMREHLYKEQMAFFFRISKEITAVSKLFDHVLLESAFSSKIDKSLEQHVANIYSISDEYDIIVPDEVFSAISNALEGIEALYLLCIQKDGKLTRDEYKKHWVPVLDLVEEMREFAGVDELSEENRGLLGGYTGREFAALSKRENAHK